MDWSRKAAYRSMIMSARFKKHENRFAIPAAASCVEAEREVGSFFGPRGRPAEQKIDSYQTFG